ncbi:hypothetical protein QEN19_001385 [Hanseniaspora menglaensis]
MSDGISEFADLLIGRMLLSIAEKEITDTYLAFQQSPVILKFIHENMENNEIFCSSNSVVYNSNAGSEDIKYRIPTTSEFMKNLLPDKLAKKDYIEKKEDAVDGFSKEPSLDIILSQSNTPNIQSTTLNSSLNGKNPMSNLINNSTNNESIYVKCDLCHREIVSNRFAQHLERCMNGKTR